MKTFIPRLLTSLAVTGLAILATNSGRAADNDPADDVYGGATQLYINTAPSGSTSATGTVKNGSGDGLDWYKIKNSAGSSSSKGFTKFVIKVQNLSGDTAERCGLYWFGNNPAGSYITFQDAIGGQTATVTIDSLSDGVEYYFQVFGYFYTGATLPYTVTVEGSGATLKDTWSKYYTYGRTLYDYYLSIGSYDLAYGYYFLYYGYGEYYRNKASGNTKYANGAYWWFYATFAYFYYAQFGDYTQANSVYNTYVAYANQYLK